MPKNDPSKLFETELRRLEKRLDELVVITSQLKDENRSLRGLNILVFEVSSFSSTKVL